MSPKDPDPIFRTRRYRPPTMNSDLEDGVEVAMMGTKGGGLGPLRETEREDSLNFEPKRVVLKTVVVKMKVVMVVCDVDVGEARVSLARLAVVGPRDEVRVESFPSFRKRNLQWNPSPQDYTNTTTTLGRS